MTYLKKEDYCVKAFCEGRIRNVVSKYLGGVYLKDVM